jgi:hypothetical protein
MYGGLDETLPATTGATRVGNTSRPVGAQNRAHSG